MFKFQFQFQTVTISLATGLLLVPTANAMTIEGFETGLNNWSISPGGIASIKDSNFGVLPTEGSFQVFLETGELNVFTTPVFDPGLVPDTLEGFTDTTTPGFLFNDGPGSITSQGTYVQGSAIKLTTVINAQAGQKLEFDYNLLTDETTGTSPNNDLAFLSLNQILIPIISVNSVNSGDFVSSATGFISETGYKTFTHTFLTAGTFTLGFGIVDENAFSGHSGLLIDNIRLASPAQQVPEPSMVLGLFTLVGLLSRFALKK
ncbi:PEP-CTERM sorting domain-containing protein [Crocosphaera sp. XPORK-15E]|uniref:PEP-CTERM sorting domain-containing protein n=1 Tax=Crocosphaera sp. XPORK-15E TaxID=3110247 RepID=UPI002B211E69|nr:PEP-CTERM sorting domain-containing protein [Crocosphaera sp. XPORK-15E]MEA5536851.1 PEP-CTERM sorting domain-containing protein [Crocosphaera sp. XPORK-15E]